MSSSSPLPTAIQVALREEWHHVRIHLDITYNKYLPAEQNLALIIESIPPTNLALLRVDACPLEPQTTAKLNTLLASSKNLKTLCMLPGWHFSATCGRMPPITFLLLEQEKESSTPNHEWPYTPGQVVEIWDFSQLHELRLTGFDVRSFIKSVPASSLVSLRNLELRLEPKSRSHTTDEQVDMDISNFIQGIPQLEELVVTCCFLTYIADSVSKHQKTLRKLALVNTNTHDYVKWNAREDLQKIQSSCPLLMNLFVGLPFLKEDTITNVRSDITFPIQCKYLCNLVRIICQTYSESSPHSRTSEISLSTPQQITQGSFGKVELETLLRIQYACEKKVHRLNI